MNVDSSISYYREMINGTKNLLHELYKYIFGLNKISPACFPLHLYNDSTVISVIALKCLFVLFISCYIVSLFNPKYFFNPNYLNSSLLSY